MIISNNGGKVNFIDEGSSADPKSIRIVGFDTDDSCCESSGWGLTLVEPAKDFDPTELHCLRYKDGFTSDAEVTRPDGGADRIDLRYYSFDPTYEYKRLDAPGTHDDGGMLVFRLRALASDLPSPLYLVLYNLHNGYYAHGFTVYGVVERGSL